MGVDRRRAGGARSTCRNRLGNEPDVRRGESAPSPTKHPRGVRALLPPRRRSGVAAAVTGALEVDIRDVLPAIRAPTLVVHRGNPVIPPEAGRDVARRIPGARFVEVPGQDYGFAVGDVDRVIDEVEVPHRKPSSPRGPEGSQHDPLHGHRGLDRTGRRARRCRWRELLEAHEALCEREIKTFGGVVSDFAGDGVLASFDGPARAVYCALALRDQLRAWVSRCGQGSTRARSSAAVTGWQESASISPRASCPLRSPARYSSRARCEISLPVRAQVRRPWNACLEGNPGRMAGSRCDRGGTVVRGILAADEHLELYPEREVGRKGIVDDREDDHG